VHWIELYLSLHLSWVLGPFIHGSLQNLKTSEETFGHDITLFKLVLDGQHKIDRKLVDNNFYSTGNHSDITINIILVRPIV